MLIIPVDRRYGGSFFAPATLALILVNVLVFCFTFGGQSRAAHQVFDEYASSGLAALEFPYYQRQHPDTKGTAADDAVRAAMLGDHGFQRALDRGELIGPQSPDYAAWSPKRERFKSLMSRATGGALALDSEHPTALSLISHQFMHAGFLHLLGNMVVLYLVGRLVERALGAARYLALYLVCGVAAGAGFALLHRHTPETLVGASGAIAGVMGLFAVVFARRRVRFFYTLLFFAGFATLPALLLLPYWMGWELLQWLLRKGGAPVAYEAHFVGLGAGALGALLLRRLPGHAAAETRLDTPEKDGAFERDLAQGQRLFAEARGEAAQRIYERLHRERPLDPRPLERLYALVRLAPQSADYHRVSAQILALASTSASSPLLNEVRNEYPVLARPAPDLPPALLTQLLVHCARLGLLENADRLIAPLVRSGHRDPVVRTSLLRLAERAPEAKARNYRALAERYYPEAAAAGGAALR